MADWSIEYITLMNMYSFVGIQTPVEKKTDLSVELKAVKLNSILVQNYISSQDRIIVVTLAFSHLSVEVIRSKFCFVSFETISKRPFIFI